MEKKAGVPDNVAVPLSQTMDQQRVNTDESILSVFTDNTLAVGDITKLTSPVKPVAQARPNIPYECGPFTNKPKSSVVVNYPFVDRVDFLNMIAGIAYSNYEQATQRSPELHHHHFVLITGGSGIGKTRAALEVSTIPLNYLEQSDDQKFIQAMLSPIYLHIDLKKVSAFQTDLDWPGKHVPSLRIGTRVALASGIYQHKLFGKMVYDKLDDFINGGHV
ncbi:hypothetical protein SAMD00019534_083850 [Acytostelium subglobosum LB1]|uniref:hypothetical protein n=1 Tax=Acytostelium subglobosum LB1 TaxID=1410327 RepID=UPI00064511C0|nr:hypothetical protein SAMD00019534_083850 [Acytostelium subglobosum LB1]GAM25210.1 hypothetical protein SAMD00019534_083850 [Acytostelium subglobosum LB1]|eukprot:XP_012751730.1 hypothetical protein SAMD00019534_083850 [Acytostelium subglobosum LB1]